MRNLSVILTFFFFFGDMMIIVNLADLGTVKNLIVNSVRVYLKLKDLPRCVMTL